MAVRQIHVQVSANAPAERVVLVGSHEAIGAWDPQRGLDLDWRYNAWVTKEPIILPPGVKVECKFVRMSERGHVEWESGPNRVLEIPKTAIDVQLKAKFNGESVLSPEVQPNKAALAAEKAAAEKAVEAATAAALAKQEQEARLEAQREAHQRKQAQRAEVVTLLQQQLEEARLEVERLAAEEQRVSQEVAEVSASRAALSYSTATVEVVTATTTRTEGGVDNAIKRTGPTLSPSSNAAAATSHSPTNAASSSNEASNNTNDTSRPIEGTPTPQKTQPAKGTPLPAKGTAQSTTVGSSASSGTSFAQHGRSFPAALSSGVGRIQSAFAGFSSGSSSSSRGSGIPLHRAEMAPQRRPERGILIPASAKSYSSKAKPSAPLSSLSTTMPHHYTRVPEVEVCSNSSSSASAESTSEKASAKAGFQGPSINEWGNLGHLDDEAEADLKPELTPQELPSPGALQDTLCASGAKGLIASPGLLAALRSANERFDQTHCDGKATAEADFWGSIGSSEANTS